MLLRDPTIWFRVLIAVATTVVLSGLGSQAEAQLQLIFADGFESGDTSTWFKVKGAVLRSRGNSLEVTEEAALQRSMFGLQLTLGGGEGAKKRAFVETREPKREKGIFVNLRFHANRMRLAEEELLGLVRMRGKRRGQVRLSVQGTEKKKKLMLLLEVRDDAGSWLPGAQATIKNNLDYFIEIGWMAATEPGVADGGVSLSLNRKLKGKNRLVDNDQAQIDQIRIGAVRLVDVASTGSYYLDEFELFRTAIPGARLAVRVGETPEIGESASVR